MAATAEAINDTLNQATATGAGFSPLVTGLIGTVIALTLYEYWRRNTREWKMVSNIPDPPKLPFIGHAHLLMGLTNAGE